MEKTIVINDKRADKRFELFNEVIEVEASIDILRKKMGILFNRPKMTAHGFYKGVGRGYIVATPAGKKTKLVCCFTSGRQLEVLGRKIHKAEKKQAKLGR